MSVGTLSNEYKRIADARVKRMTNQGVRASLDDPRFLATLTSTPGMAKRFRIQGYGHPEGVNRERIRTPMG